jgi:hypothetical protein
VTDKIDNGGPAFPSDPNTQPGFYQHHGMTLRDWFAGQALVGQLSSWSEEDNERKAASHKSDKDLMDMFAYFSYAQADAMLAARKAKP